MGIIKLFPHYHTYTSYINDGGEIDRLMNDGAEEGFVFCFPVRLFMN